MSTAPVVPAVPDLTTAIHTQFAALAHKQVQVSYALLGVLILVLGLAGAGGWFGLKAYERQVAAAQVVELRYESAQKDFQTQLAQHDAQRTVDAQQESALLAQIAFRTKQVPPQVIQVGLAPSATLLEVKNALQASVATRHPDMGDFTLEGTNVVLVPAQAQKLTIDEVSLTVTTANLTDTQGLLSLANTDKTSLTSDVNQCKSTLSDAQKSIEAYKKVAIKSKWQRFLQGAEKVGIFLAGAAIGHAI